MKTELKGIIHGKVIELEQEPGLPDGQVVAVELRPLEDKRESSLDEADLPRVESWMYRLVFDPAILPGERIVKGTRLAAEALVKEVEGGQTDEGLLKAHPQLAPEDVAALHAYARTPVGLRRSFGAWAEDALELDNFLEELRQLRKLPRRGVDE